MRRGGQARSPDVVVIGAGIVGAACALAVARAGLHVTVVERGAIAGGTTSGGEGNLLVSDKPAGPELDLALHSLGHWEELATHLEQLTGRPRGGFELEHKGGLIVAAHPETLPGLADQAEGQRAAGVEVVPVDAGRLAELEPHLATDLAGGMLYPQDAQLQPMLATAALLRAARHHGTAVLTRTAVTALLRDDDRVTGVVLDGGRRLPAATVVNAAGPWAEHIAQLAGVHLPVMPRRGVVLVTQPLPPLVRHKVYAAEYIADVGSDATGLESSAVVEGTPSGTILIGASRERVGFAAASPVDVVRRLAAQAVRAFPVLAGVRLLRTYHGFRPYTPDHLPVIGPDPRAPGLVHACGHEGAGVVLAAGTGQLVAELIATGAAQLDLNAVRPERFGVAADG
jgi:glycine/D-amino acid oxidase-like deaminating enzyme